MQKLTRTVHLQNTKRTRAIMSFVAAGLFLSGCSKKEEPEATPTVTVQVDAAEKQAIQRKVVADAILYPLDQAAITPKVISPIKKFYVDRGSHVKAGQLLAELEDQDLAGAQMKSQGGFQQAEAIYQMQLQKVGQDAKLARQTLDAARKLFDSREALYKEGAVSAKDVEDARIALTLAQNQYELAQKQADLKVAEGQLNAAKGDTDSAEAQLSYTRITSPIDGVVTDRPFYPGETPATGSPLITVMDLSQIVARAHISQHEAYHLKLGDPATISMPGQNPAVKGKVTVVSPALDPNSTTVEVWVQAANPGGRLRPGASARRNYDSRDSSQRNRRPSGSLADGPRRSDVRHRAGMAISSSQEKGQSGHPGWQQTCKLPMDSRAGSAW